MNSDNQLGLLITRKQRLGREQMKLKMTIAAAFFGLLHLAHGGELLAGAKSVGLPGAKSEIDFSFRGIVLGMGANDFILPIPPDEFPKKHLSDFGRKFGVIHIQLTEGDAPCGYGQNNDCFSASAVLSDPELGPSKVLAIDAVQSYKIRPNFDALTSKLIAKYGPARLTHRTKSSVDYVWAGSGNFREEPSGNVSEKDISGKYIYAHVSADFRDPSKATGYKLTIVDSELREQNGDLVRKRLMDRIKAAPKPEDAVKF
jgi:hypothetical protein